LRANVRPFCTNLLQPAHFRAVLAGRNGVTTQPETTKIRRRTLFGAGSLGSIQKIARPTDEFSRKERLCEKATAPVLKVPLEQRIFARLPRHI